jgi:hypothetical protein
LIAGAVEGGRIGRRASIFQRFGGRDLNEPPRRRRSRNKDGHTMLTLDLPAEPYWLDLPRGVRVEIRPVTTAVMAAAQAAAARRLAAIRIADPALDPDMSRGLSFAFLVKALAHHAVTAWEGVGDAAGKPLPLSPEAVERLMDLDDIAAAFWDRATAPVAAVAAEGNA